MKSLFILILSLFSLNAYAEIQLGTINGALTVVDPGTSTIEVIAGFNGTCATATTGLCNTCESLTTTPCTNGKGASAGGTGVQCCGAYDCEMCNTNAVTDTTLLTIPFTSSSTSSGTAYISYDSNELLSQTGVGSGGQFTFTRPWSDVCNTLLGCSCSDIRAGTCAAFSGGAKATRTVTVGIKNGESATINFRFYSQPSGNILASASPNGALSSFSIYPGDEKVYLESPEIVGYTEGASSDIVKKIQVYIGTGSFDNAYSFGDSGATGDAFVPSTLSVDAGGIEQVVDGLENDQVFHFRTATVDEAGNIYAFVDNAMLISKGCVEPSQTGGIDGTPTNLCAFAGTPSKVLGLLSEDMNCFVATAAYGTQLDPHINTFRDFRFKVLLRSPFGKFLNHTYYKYGPQMAEFIKDREWARATSRVILWPAWGFASISLYFHWNLWQTLSFFFATLFVVFGGGAFLLRKLIKRSAQVGA